MENVLLIDIELWETKKILSDVEIKGKTTLEMYSRVISGYRGETSSRRSVFASQRESICTSVWIILILFHSVANGWSLMLFLRCRFNSAQTLESIWNPAFLYPVEIYFLIKYKAASVTIWTTDRAPFTRNTYIQVKAVRKWLKPLKPSAYLTPGVRHFPVNKHDGIMEGL